MNQRGWKSILAGLVLALLVLSAAPVAQISPQDEVRQINEEIELLGLDWVADVTPLTLMTPAERRMRLGAWAPTEEEFPGFVPLPQKALLPSSINWSSMNGRNYMTMVKDQGSCGSCWAFAVVGTMEGMFNVENDRYSTQLAESALFDFWNMRTPGRIIPPPLVMAAPLSLPDLSEQDLVSCSGAGDCDGGYTDDAAQYCKAHGIVTEDCFPYRAQNATCSRCSDWTSKLSRINSWQWVTKARADTNSVKTALQDGPVTGDMKVYSDFYNYRSGVYSPTSSASFEGWHAVVIVGYNDSQNCWICKNSWDDDWGEDGYFRIRRGVCEIGTWVLKLWGVRVSNRPPVLAHIGTQNVKEGIQLIIQLSATDPDGGSLTYEADQLPQGATFSQTTGKFEWTPSYTQSGIYRIVFKVSDGFLTDSESVRVEVINVKQGKGKF